MGESPGKVLSSFASSCNERNGSISKLGGCAGVFSQLLDRFNGRKLFPHKLLPSDSPRYNSISHTEEKLPMAKLLLIADENRIRSSKQDGDCFLEEACQEDRNCEDRRGKKSVGVVARLMGLETMPSPEPFVREKQFEVFRDAEEVQSTRKPLQISSVLTEEGGESSKAINTRIQALKKRAKLLHKDQLHKFEAKISSLNSVADATKQSSTKTSLNSLRKALSRETVTRVKSIEAEDPKVLFISKLPAMPSFQVESPLRSIFSPSRTSSKLLSPIKSPLSSKSKACLFGAVARVLEPSMRPARHLGFHPHDTECTPQERNLGQEMNEQEMITSGASSASPLVRPALERRNSAAKHLMNLVPSSSPSSMSTESKGQAKSRNVNSSSGTRARSSSSQLNAVKQFVSKQEQAKKSLLVNHEKKVSSKLAREQRLPIPTSRRQEVSSSSNGGSRLLPWRKSNPTSIKGSHVDSEQDNSALPVHVKEENTNQGEGSKRWSQPIISKRQSRSTKGSSMSTVSHTSRTSNSVQDCKKSLQPSLDLMNQERSGIGIKTSSQNIGKALRSRKSTSTGAQNKNGNSGQVNGGSLPIRPSAKRKASNHLPPKLCARVEGSTAVGGDFVYDEGMIQSFDGSSPSISKEKSSIYQSDLDTPMVFDLDSNNVTCNSEVEAVVHTRVRARWDIGDETKRNITKNCISCRNSDHPLADFHSGGNSTRGGDALQTTEAAEGMLEELLLSLNVSPTEFCEDGSHAFFIDSKSCCGDFMGLSDEPSNSLKNSFLQGAEQRPQNYDNKEDTSIRDCESVSDFFCAEEFEQPSPISILESPFQDSASSSSDNFEAFHGGSQWEVTANEISDCMSIMGKQIEDVEVHVAQRMGDCTKFMDVTSFVHCIDPGVPDVDATMVTFIENEDAYAKRILEAGERSALSSALFGPAVFYQFENQTHHLAWKATMPPVLCIGNNAEVGSRTSFTSCRESALQKRKLLFDCIEEALRLSLELASQSRGFPVPCMPLPAEYPLRAVQKRIEEWNALAMSMNLDDMMEMEINTGMGRWFKFGDEVERLAENIETMIIRGLVDEFMEGVRETPALQVCA